MNILKLCCSILLLAAVLAGCDVFSTRTPEDPEGGATNFEQPVSELIVIANFQNAVKDKNTENFVRCLADTTRGDARPYGFEPSSEAGARFAEQFRNWSVQNERQAFFSMMSKIATGDSAALNLSNGRFDTRVPDSAVYVADYVLKVQHSSASIPRTAAGTLRLTITPNKLNQWSVVRWVDLKSAETDTITATWSILKAQFSN